MQNLIILLAAAVFVYLLFFRKGGMGSGMGMGYCGGHGSHGDHSSHINRGSDGGDCDRSSEPDKNKYPEELSVDRKEDVIDLRKDQFSVLTVEEDKRPKTMDRKAL